MEKTKLSISDAPIAWFLEHDSRYGVGYADRQSWLLYWHGVLQEIASDYLRILRAEMPDKMEQYFTDGLPDGRIVANLVATAWELAQMDYRPEEMEEYRISDDQVNDGLLKPVIIHGRADKW